VPMELRPVEAGADLPGSFVAERDQVHVWLLSVSASEGEAAGLAGLLSPDERDRAARFHFRKDRSSYTVVRGFLRVLLGRYSNTAPADLRFGYLPHGKPYLHGPVEAPDLTFNVAHSRDLALFGFARGREIGVDIEYFRPEVECELIAERFFSPREADQLRSLRPEDRRRAFFACWTRKEAYIKALGEGLSFDLRDFDVPADPEEPAALSANRRNPEEVLRWTLRDLLVGPAYAAAVAAEGRDWSLKPCP
jgi:4'-phosphopantetheinyl transferase